MLRESHVYNKRLIPTGWKLSCGFQWVWAQSFCLCTECHVLSRIPLRWNIGASDVSEDFIGGEQGMEHRHWPLQMWPYTGCVMDPLDLLVYVFKHVNVKIQNSANGRGSGCHNCATCRRTMSRLGLGCFEGAWIRHTQSGQWFIERTFVLQKFWKKEAVYIQNCSWKKLKGLCISIERQSIVINCYSTFSQPASQRYESMLKFCSVNCVGNLHYQDYFGIFICLRKAEQQVDCFFFVSWLLAHLKVRWVQFDVLCCSSSSLYFLAIKQ